MKDITKFKDEILFRVLYNEELDYKIEETIENAKVILKYKKDMIEGVNNATILFRTFAFKINHYENLIVLCYEFKKRGVWNTIQTHVDSNDNCYENNLQYRIKECKSIMKKLRPYILEYSKDWSLERKMRDINHEEIGRFYKNWYLSNSEEIIN